MGRLKSKAPNPKFTKPSIDSTVVDRAWKNVEAQDLKIGDLIAGMGLINQIHRTCDEKFYVSAGESNEAFYSPDKVVLAFVRKDS